MKRTILTLLVFAFTAAPAAGAAPPLVRVRATSLDAVVHDLAAMSSALGHPVERETIVGGLAVALNVPDLSFVDPTKPLALTMSMEGLFAGQNGMVAILPVKDRTKAVAALTLAFGAHALDGGIHTFTPEDGITPALFVREAEGVLIAGRAREILAGIDPAEVLSGKDLPAGSVVVAVEIEPIAPLLQAGLASGRRVLTEGLPKPPPGTEEGEDGADTEAPAPKAVPKELLPLLNTYFDFLQDGLDNVSRVQLGLALDGGHLVVRTRVVARKDSALQAFCAAQVLTGSVAATKAVPDDAPVRVVGRVQWTPPALAYLADYSSRVMDGLRTMAADSDPAVVQQLEAWIEMWDMTGPSSMMQCSRGDFALSAGYGPDGKQTMLEVFGLDTRQACTDVVQAQLERIRSNGKLRDSLVEETLAPQKLKTSIVKYTNPAFAVPGTSAEVPPEEVTVRLAQADDLFLLGMGEGSADAFRSVLARRAAAKDAPLSTAASFVNGHFDVGKMVTGGAAEQEPQSEVVRSLAGLQGKASRIELGMRFRDSAADVELGIPLALLDALGKGAAAEARQKAEEAAQSEEEKPEIEEEP